jgi:hypothetical protein
MCISCVKLPDGNYMLVPEGGEEVADRFVHYVAVDQDLDQSLEGPKANLAGGGKSVTPQVFNYRH